MNDPICTSKKYRILYIASDLHSKFDKNKDGVYLSLTKAM